MKYDRYRLISLSLMVSSFIVVIGATFFLPIIIKRYCGIFKEMNIILDHEIKVIIAFGNSLSLRIILSLICVSIGLALEIYDKDGIDVIIYHFGLLWLGLIMWIYVFLKLMQTSMQNYIISIFY